MRLRILLSSLSPALFILCLLLSDAWLWSWLQHQAVALGPSMDERGPLLLWSFSFVPGLAALITLALTRPFEPGLSLLKIRTPLTWGFAFILFPLLAIAAAALTVLFNLADWDWHRLNFAFDFLVRFRAGSSHLNPGLPGLGRLLRHFLIYSPLLMLLPSVLEALAWQGFWYRLTQSRGFWFVALTSGSLWWLWQVPLLLHGYPYGQPAWLALPIGLLFGLVHQGLLTWLRAQFQNLWPVIVARATLGGAVMLPVVFTTSYDPRWAHLHGLVGIVLMAGLLGLLAGFKLIPQKGNSH